MTNDDSTKKEASKEEQRVQLLNARLEISKSFSRRYFRGDYSDLIPYLQVEIPEEHRAVMMSLLPSESVQDFFTPHKLETFFTDHIFIVTKINEKINYVMFRIAAIDDNDAVIEVDDMDTVSFIELLKQQDEPTTVNMVATGTKFTYLPL